jgi:hypothetical protein
MGHDSAREETPQHTLDHGAQRAVGLGEPLGPQPEKLFEVSLSWLREVPAARLIEPYDSEAVSAAILDCLNNWGELRARTLALIPALAERYDIHRVHAAYVPIYVRSMMRRRWPLRHPLRGRATKDEANG